MVTKWTFKTLNLKSILNSYGPKFPTELFTKLYIFDNFKGQITPIGMSDMVLKQFFQGLQDRLLSIWILFKEVMSF